MAASCLNKQKLEECQQFLTRFLEDEDLKTCPFITIGVGWTKAELEGEIIDVLIRFLRRKECPVVLLAPLISLSRRRFFEVDLAACKLGGTQDSTDFDPVKVCKTLFDVFRTVCCEVEQNLSILALREIQDESHVNVHAIKNARRKMEDQHAFYEDINTLFGLEVTQGQSMFAVFDGHAGIEAAYYAAAQIVCELKSYSNILLNPAAALRNAVMQVDANFIAKASQEKLKSGCTAVVVLIQGVNLTVGWVGDSQVVLCKNGQAIQLMEAHTPDREDERERIEALGGCVMFSNGWRVNGTLGVSRAIGDIEQKPYVTGVPDTEEYEMEGDEEFLILACDGLWDVVEPIESVECVQKCISDGERDEAAKKLVTLAKDNRALDNITVMVVYLDFNMSNLTTPDTNQIAESEVQSKDTVAS